VLTQPLAEWLKTHGLERHAQIFDENDVDIETLRILTDDDLKEIGLPFGPRKRILSLLAQEKQEKPTVGKDATVERRQLTVLFCDMVGFTELATRLDPEALRLVIRDYENACTACITRYDGYVFTTLGDGVVALFGFPFAHEGEVERAIRAGMDILKTIADLKVHGGARLQVRIGIATGVVVVTSGERNEAVGETMNLASRLQTVAQPGTVVVNDRVRRLADGMFDFDYLGEVELKGVVGPVRIHRVLGVIEAQSRFEAATHRGLTPLVGRDAEIGQLLDNWQQSRDSGTGRAVVLMGEAGIGKSRIAETVREQLRQQSGRTLVFQFSPFTINSAFYPIRAYLERAIGHDHNHDVGARLDSLETLLLQRLGCAKADLSFVAALLSLPFQDRYGAISLSPKRAKDETMRALLGIFQAEARLEPTLFLFEDAHWADPTTLDFLNRAMDALADMPALLLVTARPEFRSPFAVRPYLGALTLAKLTPAQANSLVTQVTGGKTLPHGLAEQIIRRTDGVPLFVEELTKTILESGDLVVEDDQYAYAHSGVGVTIPETLRDSLMARLDRVAATKEIAQIGSVIGREFSYELLAGLGLMSEDALAEALRLLTASGLASQAGEIPKAVYTFSHALVQDVAYDSLLKSRRKRLHADVARAIEERWPQTREGAPELLAHHHTAAEQHDLAAPLWLQAGQVAIRRFSMQEAIAHLTTGMEITAKLPPDRSRDLLELSLRTALGPALVAHRGWGHDGVNRTLEPAWQLAQSLDERSSFLPVLNALSVHTMCTDQLADSQAWAEKLLATGAALGDDDLEIVGHRAASACHFWRGDFAAAHRNGEKVQSLYDAERHRRLAPLTNNDPFTAEGIYRSQYLWMMGYPDRARAAFDATEANARRRAHPFDLAFALTLGAQLFDFLNEPDELLRRTEEAERIGREYGIPLLGEILAEIGRSIAWLRAGRHDEGVVQLRHGVSRLKSTGHRIWIWYLQALEAEALAAAGRPDRARTLLDESVSRIEGGQERSHYAEVLRLRGRLAMQTGDAAAAERDLRKAIDVARGQQAKSWELRAATTLAELLAANGRAEEGLALLAPVYDWFSEGLDTRDLRDARRVIEDCVSSASRVRHLTPGE
jgi:class 3 adenylate cyclase/tetratricopeptide (TPR) repeat protein